MNRRILAITVSTVLLANSMAFAGTAASSKSVSDSEIDMLLDQGQEKTVAELMTALNQVITLKKNLELAGQSNEKDPVIQYGNYAEILLSAISTYSMHTHLANAEKSKLKLGASVGALLIHKAIEIYKAKGKLDASTVSAQIVATADQLDAMGAMPEEISALRVKLNNLSVELIQNQDKISQKLTNLNTVENVALIANVIYFSLHLVYPKAAKEADGFVKNILPKIQDIAKKGADLSKGRTVAYGTTGAIGGSDILSMTLGMSSKEAQDIITQTARNLDTVAVGLNTQINARKAK
ncbi:MAG: hypothetical protein H7256_05305 [Bdellovibrio sp.]|nr:hypothetical protein [Bdellovibrio sp.]